MPYEVIPPVPLQRARERGLCFYGHLTMKMTVPAGAIVTSTIKPPAGVYCWRTFAFVYGELDPAGVSDKFIITHMQAGMVKHQDPWLHSVVDEVYPHSLTLTERDPETLMIENNTGVDQTFDVTLHYMEFPTIDDWNKYRAMMEEVSTMVNVLRNIKDILSKCLKALKDLLALALAPVKRVRWLEQVIK